MYKIAPIFFSALLLTACGGGGGGGAATVPPPPPLSEASLEMAVEQTAERAIIPAVDDFAAKADNLNNQAQRFCQSTDSAELTTLQDSWKAAYASWFALANYNFGPLNDDIVFAKYSFIDSLRVRGTNYLNTVRDDIDAMVAGSQTLNDAFFVQKTFNRTGLLALEVSIFETTGAERSQQASAIVADYRNNPRKCAVLQGYAGQLLENATYVSNGWKQQFKDSESAYRNLFINDELPDETDNLVQLLVAVQAHLDYLAKRRVASNGATLAGNVWEALGAAIDQIELMLEGEGEQWRGVLRLMEADGAQVAVDSVRQNIAAVRNDIAARDAAMLDINLGKLDGNFKREIPDTLGIELGIDFSDGD